MLVSRAGIGPAAIIRLDLGLANAAEPTCQSLMMAASAATDTAAMVPMRIVSRIDQLLELGLQEALGDRLVRDKVAGCLGQHLAC